MFSLWVLYHEGITISYKYHASICFVCIQGSLPHLTCIHVAPHWRREHLSEFSILFCLFCFHWFKWSSFSSVLSEDCSFKWFLIEITRGFFNKRTNVVCMSQTFCQRATPFFQPGCLKWDETKTINKNHNENEGTWSWIFVISCQRNRITYYYNYLLWNRPSFCISMCERKSQTATMR